MWQDCERFCGDRHQIVVIRRQDIVSDRRRNFKQKKRSFPISTKCCLCFNVTRSTQRCHNIRLKTYLQHKEMSSLRLCQHFFWRLGRFCKQNQTFKRHSLLLVAYFLSFWLTEGGDSHVPGWSLTGFPTTKAKPGVSPPLWYLFHIFTPVTDFSFTQFYTHAHSFVIKSPGEVSVCGPEGFQRFGWAG